MLEVKDLKKTYKPKKGVAVEALKGVNLKFPEKGMVFLLGKSGSGKSTLLNLLGGLDQYDDGEILIKGVSSKTFRQSEFDSYRNTYVGFIFQEYNVLEEFTVGANIALAIELQGRKAENDEINEILKTVDLEGLGGRKPNELSGGQKQRVAIARALVKKPQIIMADEPTGALDSNTGTQVLETLKKLSKEKLVIVVSHDREFAEKYGDRIIELADGEVIRDVERSQESVELPESGMEFEQDSIVFSEGYQLTEEDRILINEFLSGRKEKVKAFLKGKKQGGFTETDQNSIVHHDRTFKLIKSRLPLMNAVKIGASGLKHKKIRLTITILLSFVAFSLFALADTFGSYDNAKTCTESLVDSKVSYVSFTKKAEDNGNGYYSSYGNFTDKDVKKISKENKMKFKGVYVPDIDWMISNIADGDALSETDEDSAYCTYYSGFVNLQLEDLKNYGYEFVAGTLPKEKNEVAISSYCFESFKKAGYCKEPGQKGEKITSYNDMLGKELHVGDAVYKVSGIYNNHIDLGRYEMVGKEIPNATMAEKLAVYALGYELSEIKGYSLAGALVVSEEKMNEMRQNGMELGKAVGVDFDISTENFGSCAERVAKMNQIDASVVSWVDGEKKELKEDEIILSSDLCIEEPKDGVKELIEAAKNQDGIAVNQYEYSNGKEKEMKVVGIIDVEKYPIYKDVTVISDKTYKPEWELLKGTYEYVVAPMPKDKKDIRNIVDYCSKVQKHQKNLELEYEMRNSVTLELNTIDAVLKAVSKVFLYIGLGFALFAALMLANFIATSVSYKKQEIGILRAIGARSSDVFKIFAAESMIIALVNFLLACIATGIGVHFLNYYMRLSTGVLITILNYGLRQILLLLAVSIGVALISSFIPVWRIARKKPIDAIRNK